MNEKNFFLHSSGISLLTNFIYKNEIDLKPYNYSNLTEKEIDRDIKKQFEDIFNSLKKEVLENKNNFEILKKMSAELNALFNYTNNLQDISEKDTHFLLHTDTYLGKRTAEIISDLLKSYGLSANTITYKDLRTNDFEEFLISLSDLIKNLSETLEAYAKSGYRIIFNLTGGFKSINSFLQTMASLYADESIYIFETGNSLLRIPKLPIKIDEDIFRANINLFRKLELGIYPDLIEKKIKKIPEILYTKVSNEYSLSVWGELLWQKIKKELYMKDLLKPISKRIIYTDEFNKSIKNLSPHELYQLNKTLDELELCLFNNFEKCLNSLRLKTLEGKIKEKYTHEIYPFDGNDSRRLFVRKDNDKLNLIKIDKHLK